MGDKLEELEKILEQMGSVLVAYSGGVDSTFMLKMAVKILGDKVLAVTAVSPTYQKWELKEAEEIVKELEAKHLVILTSELKQPAFSKNTKDRCYHCKRELFSKLKQIAAQYGLNYVIDGSNADDLKDYRPGTKAKKELGIRSPLQEAGLTKNRIRFYSKKMKLPTWNRPANACLASRIPYGTEITEERLEKIEMAEDILRNLGLNHLRVRYHGDVARIEVSDNDMKHVFKLRDKITREFKALGFTYVTLDLQGYRMGSMNEVI